MITCKRASEIISQSYDRKLSWRERLSLRLHLFICDACARFAKHMQFLHQAVRQFAQGKAGADSEVRLSPEAAERIKRELEKQQQR